ncbi:DUF397 domain-containing protein [Actinomadura kijaniata]|uniref:DUF397 domain-containing protein n=1 Tax=Actinomadura kijaniata TaxID=46161 RepID=UPI000A002CD2|nr:DUF397 domain-containing protein [Actinomadura kijaniata]
MDLSTATWRKSSRSTGQNDNCVEVAATPVTVALRDSKDPDGFKLLISRTEAQTLSQNIKNL